MKIRNGFVSNSSSSSFILEVSSGKTFKEIIELLNKYLNIPEDFFIKDFKKDVINAIVGNLDKIDWEHEKDDFHKYGEDMYSIKKIQEYIDKDVDMYMGSFSDNGDGHIPFMLCYSTFEIQKEDLYLLKNYAGY